MRFYVFGTKRQRTHKVITIAAGILAIFTLIFLAPLAAPRLLTKRIPEKHEHKITDITNQLNTAMDLCGEEYTTEAKSVMNDLKRFLQTSDKSCEESAKKSS